MMRQLLLTGSIACLCLITLTACDDANGNAMRTPTGPSVPSLNLAGTWSGRVDNDIENPAAAPEPDSPQVTWTASQNGNVISGPFQVSFADEDDGGTITFQGTLSGTLSGSQLALTVTFAAGSIPGAPDCSFTGSGSSTPTATAITATMTLTFSAGCIGTVSDEPTDTDRLILTKQ